MQTENYNTSSDEMTAGIKLIEELTSALDDTISNFVLKHQGKGNVGSSLLLAAVVNTQINCLANTLRRVSIVFSAGKHKEYESHLQESLKDAVEVLKNSITGTPCNHPECAEIRKNQICH